MINDNMRDLDYVEIELNWTDEEIEVQFFFSTYTRNKIKLMYGSKINTLFFIDFIDNPNRISEIFSSIPIGYRVSKTDFIVPYKFFKEFTQSINMSYLFKEDDIKHIDVAISNQDSYEKLYEYLRDYHESFVNNIDVMYVQYKDWD